MADLEGPLTFVTIRHGMADQQRQPLMAGFQGSDTDLTMKSAIIFAFHSSF
jgi:hypothetical protein